MIVKCVSRKPAIGFAQGIRISVAWLGVAALAFLVVAAPAEARKKKRVPAPAPIVDIDNGEPMILVVSTGQQKIDIYRGTKLVTSSKVSTGTASHPTKIGAFSILEKRRWHHSNMYSNAPMPWMNRITWSGTALHAGVVPGYPASHGCIRLLYSFAPKLFQMTTVGDNVIVSRGRPKPILVEHQNLFQPLPPPPLPKLVEEDQASSNESTGSPLPAVARGTAPVILAKAEAHTALDSEGQRPAEPNQSTASDQRDLPAASDPNRIHAITPDRSSTRGAHAVPDPMGASVGEIENRSAAAAASLPEASAEKTRPATPAIVPPAAAKVDAGAAAAAVQAAEPRSEAPLRMLLTRRTRRDRLIGVQEIFADMDYLPKLNFDGTMGKATIRAIKAFQKANGMPETGAFNDELAKKVYAVAGKGEPPAGHLFVRQQFRHVFDVPVSFRDADEPLGTHVYTAAKFAPGDTKVRWTVIDVDDEEGNGAGALDRIQIPDDVRRKISERLTPGSTFIVADTSINSANLPKGGDFVVLAKSTAKAKVTYTGNNPAKVRRRPPRRGTWNRRHRYYNYNYNNAPWFARPW